MTLQNHPAADLFPMMGAEELDRLTKSIREQGLIEPIITHEDMILDGRNRAKACGLAGVEPRYAKWDGAGGSPTMFAVSKNLSRRHLTLGQQAAVAVEMLPLLEEEARKRQAATQAAPGKKIGDKVRVTLPTPSSGEKAPAPDTGRARSIAAKAVGVGETSVDRAAAVKEADPAAFERIKSGESKVNTEYRRAVKGEDVTRKPAQPLTGKRADVIQNAHFRKIAESVGSIAAHCGCLETIKVEHAVAASSVSDLSQWIRSIEAAIAQLRTFKKSLERAKHDYRSTHDSPEHSGEGFEDSPNSAAGAGADQAEAN